MFQTAICLPPKRNKKDVFNLVEGEGAVNVRPYRYPHHHNNEIEEQVKEMLAKGSFSTTRFILKYGDFGEEEGLYMANMH